jgi:hypothetical protein
MSVQPEKDAFDRWWEWANKPVGSYVTRFRPISTTRLWSYRPKRGLIARRSMRPCADMARFGIVRLDHDLHLDPDSGREQA